ncbi:hypothetical protein JR338_10180 [Chloroflexota bacterium]|nr:hypothetical protein JR338_10180 [Chloroflexota bacterium]
MMKNQCIKRNVIGALLLLAITLQACSFLGENTPDMAARATWTPQPQMTDEPYHVEVEKVSYFGDDTVVAIFGSQDPEDTAPLQMFNLTTDDFYDVSALMPGPINTWSRPIMTAEKQLFMQIGNMLYKLSPGGGVASIVVPFNEEDPIFCNWSWQGQLVCVNDLLTEGLLVDQELNVTEMSLPDYTIANDTIEFYAPYRVGENTMRILQTTTNSVGSRFAVHYRDLDLTTLTVSDQQLIMPFDFRRKMHMNEYGAFETPNVYELGDDYLNVLGMTDDGELIFLEYTIVSKDDLGNTVAGKLWGEIATPQVEIPAAVKLPHFVGRSINWFYHDHMISPWQYYEGYRARVWPEVYDLRTGDLLFSSSNAFGSSRIVSEILPYRENWLVLVNYGASFMNEYGFYMTTYYWPDEILEAFTEDGSCTITQPMEP